jgi:nucleotide-binding universal stress UspA family protein
MYRKMLVGYATDRHGADALALARMLACAESVEEVLIVEVSADSDERRLAPHTAGWPPHVNVSPRVVSGESPGHALTSTADSEGADVLVLGTSHRGFLGRLVSGTTAGSIFPGAGWPVVVAPQGYGEASPSLRKVGVAFDGSAESGAALRWAIALASAFSADMRLIAVVLPPVPSVETWGPSVPGETWDSGFLAPQAIEASESLREGMRRELAAARATIPLDHVETVVTVGDPRDMLREQAEDLDMLVVGSHGGGRVAGALLRSVSRGLANACPVPLAVVPVKETAGADAGARSVGQPGFEPGTHG